MDTPIEAAYHEAGHVVAALHLGIPVASVTIVPDVGADGRCEFGDVEVVDLQLLEASLLVSLAGPAAERHVLGRFNVEGASWDLEQAGRIVNYLRRRPAERDELYIRELQGAERFVSDRWDAISRVATLLLDKKTISGAEAAFAACGN